MSFFRTVPPGVEYPHSPLGKTLFKTATELANSPVNQWAAIERTRKEFDRREASEAARSGQHSAQTFRQGQVLDKKAGREQASK